MKHANSNDYLKFILNMYLKIKQSHLCFSVNEEYMLLQNFMSFRLLEVDMARSVLREMSMIEGTMFIINI